LEGEMGGWGYQVEVNDAPEPVLVEEGKVEEESKETGESAGAEEGGDEEKE
jgi:hypothetical protein